MKSAQASKPTGGFSVYDALYILFKHKWKILLLSLLGFAAAGYVYLHFQKHPTYVTEAKLMVRYVVERAPWEPEAKIDGRRSNMSSEVELLTSRDTAVEIARAVGPERLLPGSSSPVSAEAAAGKVLGGLDVEIPGGRKGSSFLYVSYRTDQPDLAVEVLDQSITTYFAKHIELHRSTEAFERVRDETDRTYSELKKIESDINRLKEENDILTVPATMEEFENRRKNIRAAKNEIQAAIAGQKAKVAVLEETQEALGELAVEEIDPEELAAANEAKFRERTRALGNYRDLLQRLQMLQQLRNRELVHKRPGHPAIEALDRQIAEVRADRLRLIDEYPEFEGYVAESAEDGMGPMPTGGLSLKQEHARVSDMEAKLETIIQQENALKVEVSRLSEVSFRLRDLERQRDLQEEKYRYLQKSLENAKADETLDPSRMPNIKVVQSPTPPVKSIDEKSQKVMAVAAASGVLLGVAIAFLIELVIDRRVTRPIEIETRLQLPLMLSIPYVRSGGDVSKLIGREPGLEMLGDAGDVVLPPIPEERKGELTTEADEHFIAPYASAIRDRVLFNFEINNITHKPKLIGVSGLSMGAGASTIAAGIARSFAESGDRKVLYVDLNPKDSRGQFQADPAVSLKRALEVSRDEAFRDSPRSLYFASAPTRRERGANYSLIPTKLHEMMPLLSGSDYDYIIFDMPPVDPTSPTLAMGGFMDKMLLVLDANHTTREALRWGYSELEKGRADVSCIYNKARSHAPDWVQGAA